MGKFTKKPSKFLNEPYFLPYTRSRKLDRINDLSVVRTASPFDINEFTAPACVRRTWIRNDEDIDGCFASIYLEKNNEIKTMYTRLEILDESMVRKTFLIHEAHSCTSKSFYQFNFIPYFSILVQFHYG